MVDWLVARSSRTRFVDRSGRAVAARFEPLRRAALAGRLASLALPVRGALAEVENGDTVWLFWPEQDLGVIAVGRAREPRAARGRDVPQLVVTLDRPRTRALMVDPMPAPLVRRWLPDLRGAARLDVRPRAFDAIRAWQRRDERDAALLTPLGARTWRSRAGRGGRDRPVDDPALAAVVPFLRSQDFAVGLVTRDQATRVVARRSRDLLVVHAVGGDGARGDTFTAFGRVRAHRWALERAHGDLRLRAWAWLTFATKPPGDALAFLEDEGIIVTWRHGSGSAEMGEASKQRWYQQLGLR
jgi:hypothetical protein